MEKLTIAACCSRAGFSGFENDHRWWRRVVFIDVVCKSCSGESSTNDDDVRLGGQVLSASMAVQAIELCPPKGERRVGNRNGALIRHDAWSGLTGYGRIRVIDRF